MYKIKPLLLFIALAASAAAELTVKSVDLLRPLNLSVNAAGPVLVQMDTLRQRLVIANTLTSSITLNDIHSWQVSNIPLSGRALQHLKAEAMTIDSRTGNIALIGDHAFHLVDPAAKRAKSISTSQQFESIAWDEATGNLFLAGRESRDLLFYERRSGMEKRLAWQESEEKLINLNQTPPPPLRKVIADPGAGQIIAVDGHTATITLLRGRDGKRLRSFSLPLHRGGRWHLAGFDRASHLLYLVIETAERKVIEAARIEIPTGACQVIALPQFTEGVGITCHPGRGEIYVPYDNHPSVHVVNFAAGSVQEIMLPNFGNDATALDPARNILYVASWAQGEVDMIDLEKRSLVKRIRDLGILPLMFNMAFDPHERILYIPKGATAVNGAFGAAVTLLDPVAGHLAKLYTGWAPIDLVEWPSGDGFAVFNNEDAYIHLLPDGAYTTHRLPNDYPISAASASQEAIYLSYGPHQSYWPVVYIWGAKNGILTIDPLSGDLYDRRIPRQAHKMALDRKGALYFTQNSWGNEEQFLGVFNDPVREMNIGDRLLTGDQIERETTPRLLACDVEANRLYSVKVGEKEEDPGLLHIFDLTTRKVIGRIKVGRAPVDLVFDAGSIYVANFSDQSVTVIDKSTLTGKTVAAAPQPLRFCALEGNLYLLSHSSRRLQKISAEGAEELLRLEALPSQLMAWRGQLVIAAFSANALFLYRYDPRQKTFGLLHMTDYPYGDTRFDSGNVSFYLQGQYGDALFDLIKGREDKEGRLWLSDFLAGKVYILEEK